MKTRKPIARVSAKRRLELGPFATSTIQRKTPVVRVERSDTPKRKPIPKRGKHYTTNLKRSMGTKARRQFVASLPCAACSRVGYSQNAHLLGVDGMGRKKDHTTIGPLCGPHSLCWSPTSGWVMSPGCHAMYDESPSAFRVAFPDFDPEAVAAKTEAMWQAYSGGAA